MSKDAYGAQFLSSSIIRHVALCSVLAGVLLCPPPAVADLCTDAGLPATKRATFLGFGASTTGGNDFVGVNTPQCSTSAPTGCTYIVTKLTGSDFGTLADAVSQGNRYIVFGVSGTITTSTEGIMVKGANITIDGCSAPSPGITLDGVGLYMHGNDGDPYPLCPLPGCDVQNIIVRNIRVRGTVDDAFRVVYGAHHIVFDHVSAQGAGDGSIDITQKSHHVTVSWSIFADPTSQLNSLLAYKPYNLTMHHNLFTKSIDRNPGAAYDYNNALPPANETTLDFWNNLVWAWGGGRGSIIWYHSQDNIVNNYYYAPPTCSTGKGKVRCSEGDNLDALIVCSSSVPSAHEGDCNRYKPQFFARAYVAGNFNPYLAKNNVDINAVSTEDTTQQSPFPGQPPTDINACTAAQKVKSKYSVNQSPAGAGAYPLDSVDESYLSDVTSKIDFTGCPTS